MSVEIGVFYTQEPLTDEDALARYSAIRGKQDLDRCTEPDPHMTAFLTDLTSRFPRPGGLPESERANSPWSGDFDESGGHALFAMSGSHCDEAVECVMVLAEQHGLVCFDPGTRSILTAPPGIHIEKPASGAIWPLTLATLSLALVGLLLS